MFFYLCKVLFSGFLEFRGNFVDGRNNLKYRDVAPLSTAPKLPVIAAFSNLSGVAWKENIWCVLGVIILPRSLTGPNCTLTGVVYLWESPVTGVRLLVDSVKFDFFLHMLEVCKMHFPFSWRFTCLFRASGIKPNTGHVTSLSWKSRGVLSLHTSTFSKVRLVRKGEK